ncbi:cytochrome c [Marinobacterium sp. D7]|uniref:c-type cytochrome n=1 Tax=Marinobacterium ramblicola TaxID=2849041 RepID=UPI001C2D35BE|nr:cytochrome c [Marinobacterium ramblicola]MBV1788772.1 cytochrome c [Marinobacterium ramblicola]
MPTALRLGIITTCLLLAACGPKDPARMKSGEELYDYYCRSCHVERNLGARLERLPSDRAQLKPHELVLMIRHDYTQPSRHPDIRLPQLSPEQADAVAQYAYKLRHQGN